LEVVIWRTFGSVSSTNGLKFEKQVQSLLEKHGWYVIKKGQGVDLIAIRRSVVLVIECKNWRQEICGKTLRVIVSKLKRETKKLLKHPYFGSLLRDKEVIPVFVSKGRLRDLYQTDPVRVFEWNEFVEFVAFLP